MLVVAAKMCARAAVSAFDSGGDHGGAEGSIADAWAGGRAGPWFDDDAADARC